MIVEFSGLPKSGKTSIAQAMRDYFVRHDLRVIDINEPAHSCPFPSVYRVETAAWIASKALADVVEATVNHNDSLVIMDRGLFDSLAFLRLLIDQNLIIENSLQVSTEDIQAFINHSKRWGRLVDLVIYFDVDITEALSRDLADKMNAPPSQTILNPQSMKMLRATYEDMLRDTSSTFPQVEKISRRPMGDILATATAVKSVIAGNPSFKRVVALKGPGAR